jgi:hypothetical protein
MTTQVDTFQEIKYAKILSVPVPIYRMKQPHRLSLAEYGFSLVLVRDLATSHANIHEMPVERERALDSWFVGYMWTPIVYVCSKNNSNLHIGWKFTSVNENNNGGNNEFFYALIIDMNKRQKTGWMVTHIMTEL